MQNFTDNNPNALEIIKKRILWSNNSFKLQAFASTIT